MGNNYNNARAYKLEDMEQLIDNLPYAVWIKGSDGIYKYVNKYYAKLSNMNPADIIGKNDYEFRDKKTAELLISEDKSILNSGQSVFNRKTFVNNEFTNIFEIYKSMVNNEESDAKLIGGIVNNVTLDENIHKEMEKITLRLLDDKKCESKSEIVYSLKNTLNADGVSVFTFDKENKKMNIFLKTYDDNIIPKDFTINLTEEEIKLCINANDCNKCIETQYEGKKLRSYVRTYFIEFENELIGILNIHYNDKTSYMQIQENLIRNTNKRFGLILKNKMIRDDYELELEKRKESEKKLHMFLENTIDFYIVVDSENLYFESEQGRKKFEDFLGYSIEEINNRRRKNILHHPDDEDKIKKVYETVKICRKVEGIIIRYLCADNEYKSIEWNITYISDEDKFIAAGRDITSSLKLEKEKIELKKTIEMESLKTDFFANMSHEFKTPLNIILTTVQVLCNKISDSHDLDDEEMIKRYLKGIKQNSYRLLKIVNNIMDINKIDSGSYDLELGNYNIVSVVEDIVLSVAGYFKQNKRNIVFDTMEEEIIMACDPMKIERIILNLLSNALKYTDEDGNIEVFMYMDKKKNEAVISVKNDGDPIPDEDKEKIFERFSQSKNLFTRKAEGTGIGLFLVKLLVELHGGKIYVDKSESKETKFVINLPIRLIEEKKENYSYTKQIVSKVETCNIEFSDIYSI